MEDKIRVELRDVVTNPFPEESFSLIVSVMTFHHIESTEQILGSIHRMLKHGGMFAVIDLEQEDGSFHKEAGAVPHNGFDLKDLKKKIEAAGFENPVVRESIFVIKRPTRDYPLFMASGVKK